MEFFMYSSTGTLIYDPNRDGMKRRTKNWAVLLVNREITRYYRWWIKKELHINLKPPSWDAHISVLRGEKTIDNYPHLWKKYHKRKVDFKYNNIVRCAPDKKSKIGAGYYYYLTVESDFLLNIRKEYHLPHDWNLHLTIGRTIYNKYV